MQLPDFYLNVLPSPPSGGIMKDPSIVITIEAPPQRVWEVIADVEHWSEWTPSVTAIRKIDKGPLAVGSRLLIRQPKFPPAVWKMTEFEEGRSFTWKTTGLGVFVSARHSVEAIGNGSRVTLALQFGGLLGGIMARLTRDLNKRYLQYEAFGLQQHCCDYPRTGVNRCGNATLAVTVMPDSGKPASARKQ
jgi:uncharacterized protein YndB with AHSA1/START domain